jgi:hypothetical protein
MLTPSNHPPAAVERSIVLLVEHRRSHVAPIRRRVETQTGQRGQAPTTDTANGSAHESSFDGASDWPGASKSKSGSGSKSNRVPTDPDPDPDFDSDFDARRGLLRWLDPGECTGTF